MTSTVTSTKLKGSSPVQNMFISSAKRVCLQQSTRIHLLLWSWFKTLKNEQKLVEDIFFKLHFTQGRTWRQEDYLICIFAVVCSLLAFFPLCLAFLLPSGRSILQMKFYRTFFSYAYNMRAWFVRYMYSQKLQRLCLSNYTSLELQGKACANYQRKHFFGQKQHGAMTSSFSIVKY